MIELYEYQECLIMNRMTLENQLFYPIPRRSQLIFFAPPGAGVDEENQWSFVYYSRHSL